MSLLLDILCYVIYILTTICVAQEFDGKLIFLNNTNILTSFDTKTSRLSVINTLQSYSKFISGAIECESNYYTASSTSILRYNLVSNEETEQGDYVGFHQFACTIYEKSTLYGALYTVATQAGETFVETVQFGGGGAYIGNFNPNGAQYGGFDQSFSFDKDNSIYNLYASFPNFVNTTGYLWIMNIKNYTCKIAGPYFYPATFQPYFIVPPHNNDNNINIYGVVMNSDNTKFWWVQMDIDNENNIIFKQQNEIDDWIFNPSVAQLFAGNNVGFTVSNGGNSIIQFDTRNGTLIKTYAFTNSNVDNIAVLNT